MFCRRLWHCCKFLCSKLSKATELIDFMKHSVIRKLLYKVKINGGLIMFLWEFRNNIFLK